MENFIGYLLKTSVAVTVFYLAYRLLFQKGKHFFFNRIYLTSSMLISFVIPLVTFQVNTPLPPLPVQLPTTPVQTELNGGENPFRGMLNWQAAVILLYSSGFLVFLLRLLAGHLRAHSLLKRTEEGRLNNISFRISAEDIHPFTYFHKIIIPSGILKSPHMNIILRHEQIHVKEQHIIDVCITELLILFQWFNPFAWLLKDAVKDNLEFLTDDRVIRHANRQSYQMAMVSLAGKSGVPPFLTALNGSKLKNRIIMMKTNNKNKGQLIKKLLLLPLLTLLVMTLSNKEFRAETMTQKQKIISGKVTDQTTGKPVSGGVSVLIKGKPVGTITDEEGNYVINMEADDTALVYVSPGFEKKEIIVGNQSQIDVRLERQPGTTYPDISKNRNENKKTLHDDKPQIITDGGKMIRLDDGKLDTARVSHPLIIIDGKEMGKLNNSEDQLPPPENIESISVLKEGKWTKEYGEDGKDGVIIIKTKKKKE